MTLPNHVGAYEHEFKHFERAIEEPSGIRVYFGKDKAGAMKFQLRLHQARSLDRQQTRRLYATNDIRHGKSEYDPLVIRVKQDVAGDWWVYFERPVFDETRIEPLEEPNENARSTS